MTEAGRLFLPEARAVLERAAAAERVLDDVSGLTRGSLRLAASQTLASYWLPARLVRFRKAHPGIELLITIGNSEMVATEVRDMRADLGFVEGAAEAADLSATALDGDELHLVVAPEHPWAREVPNAAGLRSGTWVMREPGSGTREQMDSALGALGIDTAEFRDALELPSNEAVRAAVAMGGGATLLSGLVTESLLQAGELVRVSFPAARRTFRMLRHPQRHETAAAKAFAELVIASVVRPE